MIRMMMMIIIIILEYYYYIRILYCTREYYLHFYQMLGPLYTNCYRDIYYTKTVYTYWIKILWPICLLSSPWQASFGVT